MGPLPEGLTVEEAIAVLDTRLRRVHDLFQAGDHGLHDELTKLNGTVGGLDTRVGQVATDLRETARTLRVEGLRVQAVGPVLVGVGLILQALGQASM